MSEIIRTWWKERKLDPHERFERRTVRRLQENERRRTEGLPPKGLTVDSAEATSSYARNRSSGVTVAEVVHVELLPEDPISWHAELDDQAKSDFLKRSAGKFGMSGHVAFIPKADA